MSLKIVFGESILGKRLWASISWEAGVHMRGQAYEIDAKTPYRGAQQLKKMLTIEASRQWGVKQSDIHDIYLRKTGDAYGGGWEVAWEGGPYEWPIAISSGAHLWTWQAYGQGDYSSPTLRNVSSLPSTHGIFFEPYNHYTMACYYA
tara:strand:+ start:177 stop:617 length:441 start_codon:yes stop_codon:yes gene_type:complete